MSAVEHDECDECAVRRLRAEHPAVFAARPEAVVNRADLRTIVRQAWDDEPGARDVARDALLVLGYVDARIVRALRPPGDRLVANRMRYALENAGLRTTTHGHEDIVVQVGRGYEGASCDWRDLSPRALGLPGSYARTAFRVTCSIHRWLVSSAILDVPDDWQGQQGCLYLTRALRVRNGRGTSLVCEMNVHGRWVRCAPFGGKMANLAGGQS